jgi:hypothetical protein
MLLFCLKLIAAAIAAIFQPPCLVESRQLLRHSILWELVLIWIFEKEPEELRSLRMVFGLGRKQRAEQEETGKNPPLPDVSKKCLLMPAASLAHGLVKLSFWIQKRHCEKARH